MKKYLKVMAVFVVALVFFATGCEKKTDLSAYAGTYQGQYTKFVGDPESSKDESEEFSLELTADGKGTHHRNDMDYNVTWSLDGENFTMKETFMGISIDYTGTLKDGKLNIFNGDPNNDLTAEYVYIKK